MTFDRASWFEAYRIANHELRQTTPDSGLLPLKLGKLLTLEREYAEALPTVVVSRCPFCDKPACVRCDLIDFTGPWWHPDFVVPDEASRCPHFLGVLGSVHRNGETHMAGRLDVFPGPEVPFVVPRLLSFPGMTAVVGTLTMRNGCTAYPVGYFAPRRPPTEDRFASWARTVHAFDTPTGPGWRGPEAEREFELYRFVLAGAVQLLNSSMKLYVPSADDPLLRVAGSTASTAVRRRSSWV